MKIHEAADRGELTPEEALLIVRSLLTEGIDTTVNRDRGADRRTA